MAIFYKKHSSHKYSAKKTIFEGKSFPSRGEANLFALLRQRENLGEIKDVGTYYTVSLTEACVKWKLDAHYFCLKRNRLILCEFKGVEVEPYMVKKKLYRFYGPQILEIYKANHRGIYLDETITPLSLQTEHP